MSGLRRFFRRLFSRFAGWVLGARFLAGRTTSETKTAADVRSILVIRIDERVGNVLLTTPLLDLLRQELPQARVDLLVAASKATLVEGLANVIPFERKDLFTRPPSFFRLLFRLRRAGYDAAIDASHWHDFSTSAAMLLAWTKAPIRIAHARGEAERFATRLIAPPSHDLDANEVQQKLRLLEPLGITGAEGRLRTTAGAKDPHRARMERWSSENGLERGKIVGIAPGGRKADHRAPSHVFAELGHEAERLGFRPLVLWGPGEEALASEVGRAAKAVLAPPTNLEELAALMRLCAAVVTNDTGPMHLSVACGVPTIALFVRADHRRWGHAYSPHAVIPAAGRPEEEVLADARDALRRAFAGSSR